MSAESGFAEIGIRSNFSFLEGASHPEELAVAAKRLGLLGIGVADRNTVAGTVRVHLAAKEAKRPSTPVPGWISPTTRPIF
jgi:error-prone DNA polymerase